ncbi:MAG: NAD(P)-dependent oxidoreductase [Flavobacteriales bacterium]|nr:NAD(P)-dependent oxidoreductase [Flavobacteriales bacterium]
MSEGMRLLVTGGSGFIGTNFMAHWAKQGVPLLNLDWNPPLNPEHNPWWKEVDLMDAQGLARAIAEFAPTHLVHLAARTDTEEPIDVDAYRQNHMGTRHLLAAVQACPSVQRLIITSTQFVCEAGYEPKNDLDFKPFTVYGESKRLTEMATREAGLRCAWTIIRPTTIWGPWSLRYRDVMFKVMRKGLYFHPGRARVVRSYGYVGNVVWQINRMLELPAEAVNGRVFYVGDQPFDLKVWVEEVSKQLVARPVRYIPTWIVRALALTGDVLKAVRIPFPITSGRYRSMTSDYITPMDRTIDAVGEAPFGMAEAVTETIRWYDNGSERWAAGKRKDARTDSKADRA